MADAVSFDEFLDWLRAHGLDPQLVKSVSFVPEGVAAQRKCLLRVHRYKLDGEGKRFLTTDDSGERVVATETVYVPLASLPFATVR